jgi:hypothetical protein
MKKVCGKKSLLYFIHESIIHSRSKFDCRWQGEDEGQGTLRASKPLGDWHEETLARMRALILEAEPEMLEERKWKKPSNAMAGVPVWSHNGIVCTGGGRMRRSSSSRLPGGPASQIHHASSIPAWKALCEGRSIFTKGRKLT